MSEETYKYENQPNYEAEYHRQLERNFRLERENDELKAAILGLCKTLFKGSGNND